MSLFDPHMTPGGKLQIPNPYSTSAHMPNHILEYQLFTPENVNVVQVKNFTEKRTPWDKLKALKTYCASTRHTHSYPRVSFVYFIKCRQSSCDNNFTKNVIFWSLIDPSGKYENSKTLLLIFKTCPIRS